MIITYEEFLERLNNEMKHGDDLYLDLLYNIIDYPKRYCGLFRLSNAKTKLIQNVTQSNEIKFGDFMENLFTYYFDLIGFNNLSKEIGTDENGDRLSVDQLFTNGNIMVLIEQKVRDDHDSTKKRGQFANFYKKYKLLREKYPKNHLISIMWFIDDGLKKNRNYYLGEMSKLEEDNSEFHLCYGSELFQYLENPKAFNVWEEVTDYLAEYRRETKDETMEIPDFGSSPVIFKSLMQADNKHWKKLNRNSPIYERLRDELFSGGDNLEKAKEMRENKGDNNE